VEREFPTGTVTFLFTDVEGSTRLLHELGDDAYADTLAEHHAILRGAFVRHDGVEVDTQGDAFFCVFDSARNAVACAQDAQEQLAATAIRVRMGVHSGEALLLDDHYVGLDVHRAARVAGAAHGGQVLLSPASASLLEPGSFPLSDLGEHRLKDLSAPVHLYQLGSATFPALKTLHRTNLPIPATPFLGRQHELEGALALARQETQRLLTLTGPGGTGKTRLALQIAAELADEFPGGVFWTPLASLRDAALVPSAVAHALGVEEEGSPDVAQSIASSIASRTLLLVDNCEHVLDGVARVVSPVLGSTDELHVIATSREPLSLLGERVFVVDPLERSDAVELFLARAEAAGASDLDEHAVTQLCEQLDDLPLAIELAAARTPALPPQLLLERLADRLDLLRGTRDADERQKTLASTISWSYDLLGVEEQDLFRHMSIFVGGATVESVERVAEADVDELASLVAKSLVRMTPTANGPRYWMLETIREWAGNRLAEDELARLRERYVEFFAGLARDAGPGLGELDARLWLDRLDAEIGNLRMAFTLAMHGDDDATAVLGATLGDLHTVRGRYAEAHETLTTALARARAPLIQARLHRLLGELLLRRDELDAAAEVNAAGLKLLGAPADGDPSWWREWLDLELNAATLHYWRGETAALRAAITRLRPFVEQHGTPRQRANFIGTEITDLLRRERYVVSGEAERLAGAYLEAAQAAGDWDGHFMLAFVLLWRGKLEEARDHFRQGRKDANAAGDVLVEMRCLVYETLVHRKLGDVEAVRALDAEIAGFEETYGYAGLVAANRAWLAWRDGDLDEAQLHGAAALSNWQATSRSGPTVFQWTARFPLLAADVEQQRLDSAVEHARRILDENQQPLPAEISGALEDAAGTGSFAAFRRAVELARSRGYT